MSSENRSLRIAFVWDWEPNYLQTVTWEDGLAAALRELIRRGHDVTVMCAGREDNIVRHAYFDIEVVSNIPEFVKNLDPDVILHWADLTRPNARPLKELGIPMALCFAGGNPLGENIPFFEHVFVESKVYEDTFNDIGVSVSRAFGTNTELFRPLPEQPKLFDTIFPATYALWKRHGLYAQAVEGLKSLAVGYMYDDHEQECWQDCLKRGTAVMPHVGAQALRYLYGASKVCVVPSLSSGGSQRTVLEAMAMNLPLIICDSDKFDFARSKGTFEADPNPQSIREMVNMALDCEVSTREYVVDNWSEYTYADALELGLLGMIK